MTDEERSTTRKDRIIAKLASFLSRSIYREIDVHWTAPVPAEAPLLSVSNHFGGFSDGLVLVHTMPRRPGIVARDMIWKVPVVGRVMTWIGGIPVHKPSDGGTGSSNDQMFASCYDALREGGHILIFPEGVTRNEPSIAPVKTGAARIVLGARASGVAGIQILPVGIHYEDKAALRSRVFVNGGRPIDLDAIVAEQVVGTDGEDDVDADDRAAVRDLTGVVNVHLRRAAPDFDDWEEATLLTKGAEIALRTQLDGDSTRVPLGLQDRLANTLADRPAESRARICDAVQAYRDDLAGVGYTDAEVWSRRSRRSIAGSFVWRVVLGVLLFPFALVGAVINIIPFLIVKAVGLLRVAPSMHATIKPAVAFLAYGVTWGLIIWRTTREYGVAAGAAAFVLLPIYLAAAIMFIDRVADAWRMIRTWRARPRAGNLEDHLRAHRADVVEAVIAA